MRELLLQYPELADTRRRRQQQPSGTSQLSLIEKEAISVGELTVQNLK